MRSTTEFLLAPLVFAILAAQASRRFGRRGLIVLALMWMAALSAWILASVPGPEVPLHDFERTPAPALFATFAGTAAATMFAIRRRRTSSLPMRIPAMTAVYLTLAVLVDVAVTFWAMR